MQYSIEKAYEIAKEQYSKYGIDTDQVINVLKYVQLSIHCWQTDDVTGLENSDNEMNGGIQVTGNHPGKARNVEEIRQDLETVLQWIPGNHKVNLHAIYGEFGDKKVDRNQIGPEHFQGWIDWAKELSIGLDFNATCFAHSKSSGGFTLSSKEHDVRQFWTEHVKQCRRISDEMGKQLKTPSIHNLWIPDGSKDTSVNRFEHRKILKKTLDDIYSEKFNPNQMRDSLESKLFGIGSESMVVGSYDFYLPYVAQNDPIICLDNGHYHPTENVADKISSSLLYIDEIMLHLTRGVRWDSDHIVTFNSEITEIAQEIVRAELLDHIHIGLDFFDGSLNRIGAYTIGARAALQAFLYALLEPISLLKKYEAEGKYYERLATLENMKTMPFGDVWNYFCKIHNVPSNQELIREVQNYESQNLSSR